MARYFAHHGPIMEPPRGLYPSHDDSCVAAAGSGRCSLEGDKETGLCFTHRKNVFFQIMAGPTVHYRTGELVKGLKAY